MHGYTRRKIISARDLARALLPSCFLPAERALLHRGNYCRQPKIWRFKGARNEWMTWRLFYFQSVFQHCFPGHTSFQQVTLCYCITFIDVHASLLDSTGIRIYFSHRYHCVIVLAFSKWNGKPERERAAKRSIRCTQRTISLPRIPVPVWEWRKEASKSGGHKRRTL